MLNRAVIGGLLVGAAFARGARGQPASPVHGGRPPVGRRLVRVAEVPALAAGAATPDGAPDLTRGACAQRLRDPRTGREYLLARAESEQHITRDSTAGIQRTTTALVRAVGEYRRIRPGADTTDAGPLRVDCTTSRVLATRRGT